MNTQWVLFEVANYVKGEKKVYYSFKTKTIKYVGQNNLQISTSWRSEDTENYSSICIFTWAGADYKESMLLLYW